MYHIMYRIITPYTLNLHHVICQLHLCKAGGKKGLQLLIKPGHVVPWTGLLLALLVAP